MLKLALLSFLIVGLASPALAEVRVCQLKKIVKNQDGSETVIPCTFSVDSSDMSGNLGSGGISRENSIGTATTDCAGFPADYDRNGKFIPYQMYPQTKRTSAQDVDDLFSFITEFNYPKHVDLGFDRADVSYFQEYAGGIANSVVFLDEAYDGSGKLLGTVFVPVLMSLSTSFQGCSAR